MTVKSYAIVDSEGNVTNIAQWDSDANPDWKPDNGLIAVETGGNPECQIGGTYIDGKFIPIPVMPPAHEEYVAEAERQKSSILDTISSTIAVWQTKLLIGRKLTADETAKLNAWLDYSDLVEAVDTSLAPDITWPTQPA